MVPRLLLAACAALWVASCSAPNSSTPEGVVELAFEAIRDGDWEAYSKVTVTWADFILKEEGMNSPFRQGGSYAGAKLKPEDTEKLRRDFLRAAGGGENQLDFQQVSFGRAVAMESTSEETLSGGEVPVTIYQVAVDDRPAPNVAQGPAFVVVKWGSVYRVIALRFPPTAVERMVMAQQAAAEQARTAAAAVGAAMAAARDADGDGYPDDFAAMQDGRDVGDEGGYAVPYDESASAEEAYAE